VDQMPSQTQQRKTLTALLIVDHLPRHFFDEELAALVRPFGTVVSAHVMRDGAGDHLDFGYVELDTLENAQCAICVLNGQEVYGHTITVGLVTPHPTAQRRLQPAADDDRSHTEQDRQGRRCHEQLWDDLLSKFKKLVVASRIC
jgi:RNA recognition motif-containing protein